MDMTPGITALNAQLPALTDKLLAAINVQTDKLGADEQAAIQAFHQEVAAILTTEQAIAGNILAGGEALLDKLFAGLDARMPQTIQIPVWSKIKP
jgi:hypothetical protein